MQKDNDIKYKNKAMRDHGIWYGAGLWCGYKSKWNDAIGEWKELTRCLWRIWEQLRLKFV